MKYRMLDRTLVSIVFSKYKMGTLARNELKQESQRAQQNFIEPYKITD